MKIYIATPVNARKEATLEEKRQAAYDRICEIRKQLHRVFPTVEFHSSFDEHIAPISKELWKPEPIVIGECVTEVMCNDAIFMDWGWQNSKGCQLEHYTAVLYGKRIIYACETEIKEEWQPCKSIDEAAAIVRANPITKDMTYEERLAAQKRRFGL